jgi:signal transduction histidine kinase
MSLTTRLTAMTMGLLLIAGMSVGAVMYRTVRDQKMADLQNRIDTREAWILNAIEHDDEDLEFDAHRDAEVEAAAEHWTVATSGGLILWSSGEFPESEDMLSLERIAIYGDPLDPVALDEQFTARPRQKKYTEYRLDEEDLSVDLQIQIATSSAQVNAELGRFLGTLLGVGGVSIVVLSFLFAWMIRSQLSPLTRIAEQAAAIGPTTLDQRLTESGGGRECSNVRTALNGMLDRINEGMEREKQFSATAAHELRTPLAQMKLAIEVALRQERDATEYRDALNDSLLDVVRLETLIESLLALTRSASAEISSASVAAVLGRIGRDYPEVTTFTLGGDEAVVANEDLLVRVIGNLIENARVYAPESPPTVTAVRSAGSVTIVVADNGPGIPEDKRESIFEPLTRLDEARSIGSDAAGFGLGLAFARTAARAFGGELVCRDREDGAAGAEFVLTLSPASEDE